MTSKSNPGISKRRILPLLIGAGFGIGALIILLMSWRTIPPGFVGIEFNKATNEVTTRALDPGWVLINPFTSAIQQYPVTIQTYVMVRETSEGQQARDDSVKVQSNEAQQLNLDVSVQYRVNREEASALYSDWGGQGIEVIADQVVRQETRAALTNIAATYKWEDISGARRGELAAEVNERLRTKFAERHLTLEDFVIREVHLPDNLKVALDNKITSQQQAQQQEYDLERAKTKAQQDEEAAKGTANAQREIAKGESDAILTRATAQAEANRLLAESVTDELIRYQMMLRWDGRLPMFTGGAMTPLIDTSSLVENLPQTTEPISP